MSESRPFGGKVSISLIWLVDYFHNPTNASNPGNPCNMHLLDLGKTAKKAVIENGMIAWQYNTMYDSRLSRP